MTRPAPAFDCALCGKVIGKSATHARTANGLVVHLRCFAGGRSGSSRLVHARVYPDCPVDWHDMYDHPSAIGSRAAIAWTLGLWGRPDPEAPATEPEGQTR